MTDSYTLITADVHLQPNDDDPINQAFYRFLDEEASKADALYIIGDLFEMWVGDDVGLTTYATAIKKLKQLTDNGLPIYLIFGNRDFLMRNAFWQATGIQPLKQPIVVDFYGEPMLLLHGDSLCTDDKAYQRARLILRSAPVMWGFLRLPQHKRISIGENMRAKSKKYNLNKAENIMDVNPTALEKLMRRYPQCRHMIHGHTHRPATHPFSVDGQSKTRWVVGDWRPDAQILKVHSNRQLEWLDFH